MEETEKEIESMRAASEEVSRQFKTLIDANDLDSLKHLQLLMTRVKRGIAPDMYPERDLRDLGRLQDSNAVLSHFNEYSEHCFAEVSSEFSRNTRMLKSMKSDLDYIFQKLRSMKAKIMATYPDAFPDESTREVFDQRPDLEVPQ
ncbi:kxDL motif-containing protein 1 [Gossypium australe]|uniref:KxDL motif-containing protein 1 n=1 Tax=Gossypium australe TaxID=47621 RepID=A0A5B6W9T1_9ROSI|nr:kxDL motif-containing protein 1 [Gossypium australe]